MENAQNLSVSVWLPQPCASQFEALARNYGLPRSTIMRRVLERWLADPAPLFDLPPAPDSQAARDQ
jgi:hypothetical protein